MVPATFSVASQSASAAGNKTVLTASDASGVLSFFERHLMETICVGFVVVFFIAVIYNFTKSKNKTKDNIVAVDFSKLNIKKCLVIKLMMK